MVDTPARDLNLTLLSQYISNGSVINGTILSRIIDMGMSPVKCALRKHKYTTAQQSDGIIDSLRQFILNENFIKP